MSKSTGRVTLAASLGMVMASATSTAWAGAWVQEQGQALWIAKYLHSEGSSYFDDSHSRVDFSDRGESRQDQVNLYLEYGLSKDLTLVGNFYVSQFRYANAFESRTSRGFSDQEVGLRYRLNPGGGQEPWVSSVQGLFVFPGYSERYPDPELGQGGYGWELRYSVGRGYTIGTLNAYLDMGAAVRLRTGDPADEFRADVATGVALSPKWMLLGEVNHIQGLGNGRGPDDVSRLDVANYDLTKLQLSTIATLSPSAQLQVGWQQPVMGRNTGTGGGPFLGFWWRY